MPVANILGAPHAYDLSLPAAPEAQGNSAETIVFIHGWLLSRRYWQPIIDQLTDYQHVTYDMRGFGDSVGKTDTTDATPAARTIPLPPDQTWYPGEPPEPESSYTNDCFSLAAYAQDLVALLDALKLDQVWLMGHSLGGSVALWAAYLFPERVKGVICLNAGGGIYIPKEFEKFRGAGRQMAKYRPGWLTKLPLLPRVFTRAMVHKPLELKWGRQRLLDFLGADRAAAEGALLASTTEAEVLQMPQLMGALSQPVHFITATQDSIMPPRYVNYLASFHRDFPQYGSQGMVSEIADCGHMAMVEQPEAVAAIVRSVVGSVVDGAGKGRGAAGRDADRDAEKSSVLSGL